MYISMKCPVCGKRAFDTSKLFEEPHNIEISLKCPNCKNIVCVALKSSNCLEPRNDDRGDVRM